MNLDSIGLQAFVRDLICDASKSRIYPNVVVSGLSLEPLVGWYALFREVNLS